MGAQDINKPFRMWIDNFYDDLVLEYADRNTVRLPLSGDNRDKLLKEVKTR